MGQSYGGYMVWRRSQKTPSCGSAAVNYYGIADFVTCSRAPVPGAASHRAREYGDPPAPGAVRPHLSDPPRRPRRAPLLVLHGDRDPRVPMARASRSSRRSALRQKRCVSKRFDYAGHGFVRPDDKRRLYQAVAEWLDGHL